MITESGKLVTDGWKIEKISTDSTRFRMAEGQKLILKSKGSDQDPIISAVVPDGKDWVVSVHIEIHEGPMNG